MRPAATLSGPQHPRWSQDSCARIYFEGAARHALVQGQKIRRTFGVLGFVGIPSCLHCRRVLKSLATQDFLRLLRFLAARILQTRCSAKVSSSIALFALSGHDQETIIARHRVRINACNRAKLLKILRRAEVRICLDELDNYLKTRTRQTKFFVGRQRNLPTEIIGPTRFALGSG